MANIRWFISFMLIGITTADLCGSPCTCVDVTVDCSSLKLKTQFDEAQWNGTDNRITEAKLNNNEFQHIHAFPELPLIYLSLANNSILTIDDGAFKLLSNITLIDLSRNRLCSSELRPDIFKGIYSPGDYEPLKMLKTLFLGYNDLHTLHPDLFEHLPNLESLSINNNPLTVIDKPTIIALSSIQKLKVLDLSQTELKTLPEYMLHTPGLLSVLNLSGNKFTSVPEELGNTHNLKDLYIDENPITEILSFPPLPKLEILYMNWMPDLEVIGPYALSNLTNLKELHCSYNLLLRDIYNTAFASRFGEDGLKWIPLERLYLNNNELGYLDKELLGDWNDLQMVNLQGNPWVCACSNQWIISILLPKMKKMGPDLTKNLICQEPIEMQGKSLEELMSKNYHMRCLDSYGHRPENDGAILIGIVIGVLIAIPLATAALVLHKRRNMTPEQFRRALYKRADATQYFENL